METKPWLNRTVLGIGLASLLSDWSHEAATTVLPAWLATMGVAAAWLGIIEGVSDGASSVAKLASGYYTDGLQRRKPIAVLGYVVTALGMGSLAFASNAWHVLCARTAAWLGRGVRTPVRKALLAGAVDASSYGRAFGFERMMDTLGAVAGAGTGLVLLSWLGGNYQALFLWTLVPGLLAAVAVGLLVRETRREKVTRVSFGESLRALPGDYRRFLLAVGVFGAGDFAHTLLILFATEKLAPVIGLERAAVLGAGFYVLRNATYAVFSYVTGWLADRMDRRTLLAGGYWLGFLVMLGLIFSPPVPWLYALLFAVAGVYIAVEETGEDTLCATLCPEERHGMGFGVLATVNGAGDFISSIVVGALWTLAGTTVAFTYSAVLFAAGALLLTARR